MWLRTSSPSEVLTPSHARGPPALRIRHVRLVAASGRKQSVNKDGCRPGAVGRHLPEPGRFSRRTSGFRLLAASSRQAGRPE